MSPKKESKYRSKKYEHLFKYPKRSRFWVYRRYCEELDKDFSYSTGEETNEKVADDIGEKAYHQWVAEKSEAVAAAIPDDSGDSPYFGDFAKRHLARKLARSDADFSKNSKRTSRNAINQLVKAFGHLPMDRVTEDRWDDYINECLAEKPQKFFNRRKELKEIMLRAHRLGRIKRLPEYRNPDPKTDAGRYLEDAEVEALIRAASPDTALLIEFLWRMGGRPSEVLAYEWTMFNWRQGKHGTLSIPAEITKTRRARTIPVQSDIAKLLKARQKTSKSRFVFPSPDTEKGPEFHIVEYRTGWESALRRSGIRHAVIYDLRRTFVTNRAIEGKPILWVAKYIDSSTQMIEQFYAKVQHGALVGVIE
jgi:integrase